MVLFDLQLHFYSLRALPGKHSMLWQKRIWNISGTSNTSHLVLYATSDVDYCKHYPVSTNETVGWSSESWTKLAVFSLKIAFTPWIRYHVVFHPARSCATLFYIVSSCFVHIPQICHVCQRVVSGVPWRRPWHLPTQAGEATENSLNKNQAQGPNAWRRASEKLTHNEVQQISHNFSVHHRHYLS